MIFGINTKHCITISISDHDGFEARYNMSFIGHQNETSIKPYTCSKILVFALA